MLVITKLRCKKIFKKIMPNDPSCVKTTPNSYTLCIERLFNNHFWVFQNPNATILLINIASKVKMSLIAHNDFTVKFRFVFMHFQLPVGKDTTLYGCRVVCEMPNSKEWCGMDKPGFSSTL